jgi:hypothetical protein
MSGDAGAPATLRRPEVIVDFDVRDGLLFVSLKNIGDASAYEVTTRFEPSFRGLDGQKDIAAMNMFRLAEFMPPGKVFVQLVDSFARYVQRKEPTILSATIAYRDRDGAQYRDLIKHDLRVYLDLAEAVARSDRTSESPGG